MPPICKHGNNDPDCSSYRTRHIYSRDDFDRHAEKVWEDRPTTPDSKNFHIEEVEEVHATELMRTVPPVHLVIKVSYPNCAKCAFEGNKVLVFLNTKLKDAIKWKVLDPHFRDPTKMVKKGEAPSPDARFPASETGWKNALAFARMVITQ